MGTVGLGGAIGFVGSTAGIATLASKNIIYNIVFFNYFSKL